MTRINHLDHHYVEFIPKDLDEGTIYISTRFKTASHLCCCGCGTKVVTPLNPAQWHLEDHGNSISLSPSIGLGTLPCRSHYWITGSQVNWCAPMTKRDTQRAQRLDRYALQVQTGERKPAALKPDAPNRPTASHATKPLWARVAAWFQSLWK